jgi:hypothetical protein
MSVAISLVARLHHNLLLLAWSPHHRHIRKRLEAIGRPPG